MAHWYTADWHFGLRRVLETCNRPFASTDEMDKALIAACAPIAAEDDLWFLGDFSFGKNHNAAALRGWFDALPGRKHLVIGNHDNAEVQALPWASVQDLAKIEDRGQMVALCHYPMVSFPGSGRGAIQLFGHVHDLWAGTRNSVNVGVDQWAYRPVQLDAILARAAQLPLNAHFTDAEFAIPDERSLPPPSLQSTPVVKGPKA